MHLHQRAMPSLRRSRVVAGVPMLVALLSLVAPGAALADCIAPPPVEVAVSTGDILFVGTVIETVNGNRWATVSVEEIWRGPDLPATVLIKGGADPNSASSIDRSFEVGVRYLFFPTVGAPPGREPAPAGLDVGLVDNSCTSTQPWRDEMAKLRPADARVGVPEKNAPRAFDPGPVISIGAIVVIVFAAMLVIGMLARGRAD